MADISTNFMRGYTEPAPNQKEEKGRDVNYGSSNMSYPAFMAQALGEENTGFMKGYENPGGNRVWDDDYDETQEDFSLPEFMVPNHPTSSESGLGRLKTLLTARAPRIKPWRQAGTAKTASSKTLSPQELCEAVVEHLELAHISRAIWCKTGTYFKPMTRDELMTELFRKLPKSYHETLYAANFTKVFNNLLVTDLVNDWKRQDLEKNFSEWTAVRNGYFNWAEQKFVGPDAPIVCLGGVEAEYIDSDDLETPVFDRFLWEISGGDEALEDRILDFLAITLAIGRRVKKVFVLGTAPDSGKSTLADFLERLFAEELVSRADMHALEQSKIIGSIVDKTLNISMDLNSRPISPEAANQVKILTGERRVQAEWKFIQSRTEYTACKLVFGTNFPLILKEYDEAFFKRLEVIPFENSIPADAQDPFLLDKLLEEKDYIVTLLLRRLGDLNERNFELTPCWQAEEMKKSWIAQSGGLIQIFLRDSCEITQNASDYIPSRELFESICNYAEDKGAEAGSINVVSGKVRKLIGGQCSQRSKTQRIEGGDPARVIRGLRWKQPQMLSEGENRPISPEEYIC